MRCSSWARQPWGLLLLKGSGLAHETFLRAVVLPVRLRRQQQLNTMSDDDQRNVLISELSTRLN